MDSNQTRQPARSEISFTDHIVDAIYRPRDDDLGVDNPLIRALPWFTTVDSVLSVFGNKPPFDLDHLQTSSNARIYRVGTLNSFVEPLTCHPLVVETIFQAITQGYAFRNPRVNRRELIRQHYEVSMNGDIIPLVPFSPSHEAGLAIFGVSGVGKTTAIKRTLSLLPPVIRHKSLPLSNLQVVWLKIDCPPDGSINQLFRWILLEYDQLLGTDYSREVGRNARLDQLINKVASVARYHHTGIIVIDEVQFAVRGAARRGDALMDFFVTFSNVVGVPLLVAGTPKAKSLFEKSMRLARRFCDPGAIILTNMAFDEEWEYFLDKLFKFQWIKRPYVLDKKMSKAMYSLTQGIHSLAVRLFQIAQIHAIQEGLETLSVELLNEVAKSRFGLVEPMLRALRSKQKRRIELYDDLLVETLANLDNEVTRGSQAARLRRAAESKQDKASALNAVSALVTMKVPQSLAMKAVTATLNQNPDLIGDALLQAAAERAGVEPINIDEEFDESELTLSEIICGASTPEAAMLALKNSGIMK